MSLGGLTAASAVTFLEEALLTRSTAGPNAELFGGLDDGTSSNRLQFFRTANASTFDSRLLVAGVATSPAVTTFSAQASTHRVGMSVIAGSALTSLDGVTGGATSPAGVPAYTTLHLGTNETASLPLNAYITRFAVYPAALSQGALNAWTSGADLSSLSLNFAAGLYKTTTPYVRTNYVLNSEAPATQTVTLPVGSYTLAVTGSGSATTAAGTATLSGAGSATAGSPNTITVTVAGTVTVTVSGSLTRFQLQNGHYPSSYVPTTTLVASTATYQSVNPADIGDLSFTGPAGYAPDCNSKLVSFAANVPRITCAGALIEEARTNLALWSQDFSNAVWNTFAGATKVGMAPVTDPAGGNTAYEIAFGPTGGTIANASAVYQTGTINSGVAYTHTLYVRAKTGTTTVRIYQDDGVGAQGTADTTVASTAWTRIPLTVTGAANAAATWGIRNNVAGNSGNVYVAFDMREAGAFATSFIATTSATVTRPADVFAYSGLSIANSLTLGVQGSPQWAASGVLPRLAQLSDGTNTLDAMVETTTGKFSVFGTGLTQTNFGAGQTSGSKYTGVVNLSAGASRASSAGSAAAAVTGTASLGTVTSIRLGDLAAGNRTANGPITQLRVYPYAANDNEEAYRSAGSW